MTPSAALLYDKWDRENDPILADQVGRLEDMLHEDLDRPELEGFLIVSGRLVDSFGGHRTGDLGSVFQLDRPEGREVLKASLRHMRDWVGGMEGYETNYPVTINPSNPAFPQLRIVGIEKLFPHLFRVLDSNSLIRSTNELTKDYIVRSGRLPALPVQEVPVLRSKPLYHWCTNQQWATPELTREGLQILREWGNDCRLRARRQASC